MIVLLRRKYKYNASLTMSST